VLTTPRITFKNIELLPGYLRRPELVFHGQPRRIILSEQGFHTPKGEDGEIIQAAAYCYAYKKIERLDGIDAFILHRHVDNAHEGGLFLGLRGNQPKGGDPQPKKKIYDCFRAADTREWEKAFGFALPAMDYGLELKKRLAADQCRLAFFPPVRCSPVPPGIMFDTGRMLVLLRA
jgi:hypothetical protein